MTPYIERMEKLKGDALKGAACHRNSFSNEKREMIHTFCEELALPPQIEDQAVLIYKAFLRRTLDTTITPKSAICASIYIAALLRGMHRPQPEFKRLFGISGATMAKWWHFVADVVGVNRGEVANEVMRRWK